MKHIIHAGVVNAAAAKGQRSIAAPKATHIITPEGWSRAQELGLVFDQSEDAMEAAPSDEPGSSERVKDPSGVTVVSGRSVRLGEFKPAGPGKHVLLADVITSKDKSPMTAGFMSWSREDSFDWDLGYDEIDHVLEGVLHLGIDGRTVEARAGDVLHIPKGSRVRFGTPHRVKLFYVTYPADWAAAAAAPRPQK